MAKKIHPYVYIILTFVGVILIGTLLLSMPFATTSNHSIGFIDALFTATSATCVTGLTVRNIASELSLFGKIVMIVLMEVGGLSFITITVFFFTIGGARIGISNRFLLREALNQSSVEGLVSLVRKIVLISFTIQLIFVFINWFPFFQFLEYEIGEGKDGLRSIGLLGSDYNNSFKLSYSFFLSLFHAAASFNNAGFDIVSSNSLVVINSTSTVIPFSSIVLLNSTTMAMIVLGSLGFVVYDDVVRKRFKWNYFSLHTKIVLITTLILIVFGAAFIWLSANFAKSGDTQHMNFMEALFTSITCRTAGFATYDMSMLEFLPITYIICIFLMLIGASPCSTGGGVKTTTLAVTAIAIYYYARGKKATCFKRRIDQSQTAKAFVLLVVAILIVFFGTILVLCIQPELGFDKVLFEIVSAFSTTGLSMGITSSLNAINRIIVVIIMFFGRLGPLTIMGVLNKNWMSNAIEDVQYVKENVMIG